MSIQYLDSLWHPGLMLAIRLHQCYPIVNHYPDSGPDPGQSGFSSEWKRLLGNRQYLGRFFFLCGSRPFWNANWPNTLRAWHIRPYIAFNRFQTFLIIFHLNSKAFSFKSSKSPWHSYFESPGHSHSILYRKVGSISMLYLIYICPMLLCGLATTLSLNSWTKQLSEWQQCCRVPTCILSKTRRIRYFV